MLRPAARPLHRAAQRAGGEQDRDVLREGLLLDAEAAADVARQHAHLRPLDVEDLLAEDLHEVLDALARSDEGVAALSAIGLRIRSEEHTSELQSLMRISYAVFCLKKKTITPKQSINSTNH